MILVRDLSYSYGVEPIFQKASFVVSKNEKVGLVGPNGAGKSTLFKLLAKEEYPDEGRLEAGGKLIWVPQEVKQDPQMETAKTIREYLGGYKEDFELRRIMARLDMGIFDLDSPPLNMSGGQKTRLAIARALVQEPDILLLDEPTNFLDIEGKKWVMQFVGKYPKTVIVISHDLDLLDDNIDKILYLNTQNKKIEEYSGNYSDFVKLKADQDELIKRTIAVGQKHIAQMRKGVAKMAHLKSEKGVRQRLNLERRIEKLEDALPTMPAEAKKIKVSLPEPAWCGEVVIMAENIEKRYGDKIVLNRVSFDIKRGERIALMGPNGAGKSTLIKILMGKIRADSGEVVRDDNLQIGYYSQEFETFDYSKTLFEVIREKSDMEESNLRAALGRFLFTGETVFQKIGSLSGGEKTRLAIALLLVQKFNLLILDEPTTYLDVLSQRLILEAIKLYQGAMIMVSHTPEFIEELKPERKFWLPEAKMELTGSMIK